MTTIVYYYVHLISPIWWSNFETTWIEICTRHVHCTFGYCTDCSYIWKYNCRIRLWTVVCSY